MLCESKLVRSNQISRTTNLGLVLKSLIIIIRRFITRHSPNKQAELMVQNYGLLAALIISICTGIKI